MSEEVDKMSFEDSMKTLEDLVKQLESGELDLDKSLEVYERAVVLRDHCKKILDESDRHRQEGFPGQRMTQRSKSLDPHQFSDTA